MSQVTIRRPFGELDLRDQLRLEPHTVFHFFLDQSPLRALSLGQVSKRASVDLKPLEPLRHFTAKLRHKPISDFGDIQKSLALVIANDQCVKRIARSVTADHKLLSLVDLVLDPCPGSLC